jgi:F420-dependent oxidoreductase-like protein
MKIGAFVPQGWRLDLVGIADGHAQYAAMRDVGVKLERLGYDGLWLYDHFHTVPDARPEATFECWTACAALAAATSTIRIGQMVGCNIYRPPALLAKIAANIDVISNGRLDFGLGAGWYEHETVAYGYHFSRAGLRLAQLDEAVQIIRGMWTEDRFQFEGHHYKVGVGSTRTYRGQEADCEGAINHPKPVQKPHPPIWIGGGGEQKTLRIVAKYADYANYGWDFETFKKKNHILDRHCEEIGRDPASVVRSVCLNVLIGDESYVDGIHRRNLATDGDLAGWKRDNVWGSSQRVLDEIARYRDEARVGYVILYFPDAAYGDSIDRFAAEVMPHLKNS